MWVWLDWIEDRDDDDEVAVLMLNPERMVGELERKRKLVSEVLHS